MSSYSNESAERRRASKVTFSPISSDILVVKIRKVSTEVKEEDIPKMSSTFASMLTNPDASHSKSNEADSQAATSLQTACDERIPKSDTQQDTAPCLKHAAENIGRMAVGVPSEKINLCNNCSKSMLSYIFVVQDFLDGLAREISGTNSPHCVQCAREEVRNSVASAVSTDAGATRRERSTRVSSESKEKDVSEDRPAGKRTSRAKVHRQESKRNEGLVKPPSQGHANQQPQMDFIYSAQSNVIQAATARNLPSYSNQKRIIVDQTRSENENSSKQQTTGTEQSINQERTAVDNGSTTQQSSAEDSRNIGQQANRSHQVVRDGFSEDREAKRDDTALHSGASSTVRQPDGQPSSKSIFIAPMERMQPNFDAVCSNDHYQNDCYSNTAQSPTLFRDGIDGIVSTLSNVEREVYDSARNTAGWEGLAEPLERLGLPPDNVVVSEAFVTSCRNNAEAIGCLVVGTSLLLCRTTRTLCVLVSDGVSTAFRAALSSVFQVVQYVRSLDSLGTTKLALLEQPELGITFEKLNIWRLVQFTKCVYLNPDTLIVQNCDELFCREELSAVPDIGWPDCFNSGVFVFSPSIRTFWQLLEFSEKQGSYDGGDQGLLNSYFNSWSSDINKKLSFIYNLMANVSYTYAPAFRHFGRDVKIVQFHGSFKPWHVKFFTSSGQISPSSPVHPTYVQFVHIWLSIFRISVLRLMSQEIQSYAASQETICAVETLRFFPLPSESESEFFLTPPSVRLRLAEKKLKRSSSLPVSEIRRRKSAEFFRYSSPDDDIPEASTSQKAAEEEAAVQDAAKSDAGATANDQEKLETSVVSESSDDVFKDKTTAKDNIVDENTLPGSEVGDYQGMKAWEQGRMDYQGTASSDNVIKRLEFLMSRPS